MLTIKLPKNLKNLKDKLPRSQYDNSNNTPDPTRLLTVQYNITQDLDANELIER